MYLSGSLLSPATVSMAFVSETENLCLGSSNRQLLLFARTQAPKHPAEVGEPARPWPGNPAAGWVGLSRMNSPMRDFSTHVCSRSFTWCFRLPVRQLSVL